MTTYNNYNINYIYIYYQTANEAFIPPESAIFSPNVLFPSTCIIYIYIYI